MRWERATPESEDEPEIGMSETALLRRRRAFIAGIILAIAGGIMLAVYFAYPYPAFGYPFGIQLGSLGASLLFTGFALVLGVRLSWREQEDFGFYSRWFRRRLTRIFLVSVIAAVIFWSWFVLSLLY